MWDTDAPMARTVSDHLTFGRFACARGTSVIERFLLLVLAFVLVSCGASMVVVWVQGFSAKHPWWLEYFVLLSGVGMVAGACAMLRGKFVTVDFYENGAVTRWFGFRREFPYAEGAEFTWLRVRERSHGFYAGTSVTVKLQLRDGRDFRLAVRHKEKPANLLSYIGGRDFVGEDAMDPVCERIIEIVASNLIETAPEGGVEWDGVRIWPEGLIPRSGARSGRLVSWKEFDRMESDGGVSELFAVGDTKPFARINHNAPNVLVGLRMLDIYLEKFMPPDDS